MLRFDAVTLKPEYEPPRPPVTPRRRKAALRTGTTTGNNDFVEDWGLDTNRRVRFVSSETQGFLTPTQVTALQTLYETGGTFALETDLLSPLGTPPVTYAARFDPDTTPLFTPATPSGSHWYFDLTILL